MKKKIKSKKVLASIVTLSVLVTGTFAWQSFSQYALNESMHLNTYETNVGARLHDDYNGINKDVYVENYADVTDGTLVFARIRLDEYFEYGEGAGTTAGSNATVLRGDKQNTETPLFNDFTTWDTYLWDSSIDEYNETIRTYRDLAFGGSTVYMPTFNKNHNSLVPDINGTYAGPDDDRTTDYDRYKDYVEYTVDEVSEPTQVEVADPEDEDGYIMEQEEEHIAKKSLSAKVISMSDWHDLGSPIGNYWVYDVDGWAYWAAPIQPQTSTGLLLDEIIINEEYDGDWYYAVNVVAQLASAGDWGDGPTDESSTGSGMYEDGMTDDGRDLLDKIAGIENEDDEEDDDDDDGSGDDTEGLGGYTREELEELVDTDTTINVNGANFYVINYLEEGDVATVQLLNAKSTNIYCQYGNAGVYSGSTLESELHNWYDTWIEIDGVNAEDVVTGDDLVSRSHGTPELTKDTKVFALSLDEYGDLISKVQDNSGDYWLRSAYTLGETKPYVSISGSLTIFSATESSFARGSLWLYV